MVEVIGTSDVSLFDSLEGDKGWCSWVSSDPGVTSCDVLLSDESVWTAVSDFVNSCVCYYSGVCSSPVGCVEVVSEEPSETTCWDCKPEDDSGCCMSTEVPCAADDLDSALVMCCCTLVSTPRLVSCGDDVVLFVMVVEFAVVSFCGWYLCV